MKIFRDPRGSYFLQLVPEIDGKRYLYSLDNKELLLVDNIDNYNNVTEFDFASTKATTPQLIEELKQRKDNPFDYKEEDVLETSYLVGYFTDRKDNLPKGKDFDYFDVVLYKESYKDAVKEASKFIRKPSIVKVINILLDRGNDL